MSKGHKKNPSASTTTPSTGSATTTSSSRNHSSDPQSNPKSILRVYLDSFTSTLLAAVRTTTATLCSAYNTTIAAIKANPRRTYNYLLLTLHVIVAAVLYSDRHNNTLRVQLGRHTWSIANNRELYAPLAATSAALITFGNYFLDK